MRLLNTTTGRLKSFEDPRTVRYAILSHVWAHKKDHHFVPEQTFQDINDLMIGTHESHVILDLLRPKIQNACRIARDHDFHYIWIDAGCIDKSSSAELSQAINSMFHWYRHANMCYAYLDDVDDSEDVLRATQLTSKFRRSRWFKRGWTLQELIAPHNVLFLTKNWNIIGTKNELANVIYEETLIDRAILRGEADLENISIATRMSWASKRETTLEEDEAYCLLGIFGIHMAPMYGEGRYAFIRLQEAILSQTADPTILAWGLHVAMGGDLVFDKPGVSLPLETNTSLTYDSPKSYLLALSPNHFEYSAGLQLIHPALLENFDAPHAEFANTAHGIRTRLPLLRVYHRNGSEYLLALLGCKDKKQRRIALLLQQSRPWATWLSVTVGAQLSDGRTRRTNVMTRNMPETERYCRLVVLEDRHVEAHRSRITMENVYIPHRIPPSLRSQVRDNAIHTSLAMCRDKSGTEIDLAGWCVPLLQARGYVVEADSSSESAKPSPIHGFLMRAQSDPDHTIRVQVGHCMREECREQGWLHASVSAPTHLLPSQEVSPISDHTSCQKDHILSWEPQHCVATKDFDFKSSFQTNQKLRLTLRLRSRPGKRSYVLEIELLELDKSQLINDQEMRERARSSRRGQRAAVRSRSLSPPPVGQIGDRIVPRKRAYTRSEEDIVASSPSLQWRAQHGGQYYPTQPQPMTTASGPITVTHPTFPYTWPGGTIKPEEMIRNASPPQNGAVLMLAKKARKLSSRDDTSQNPSSAPAPVMSQLPSTAENMIPVSLRSSSPQLGSPGITPAGPSTLPPQTSYLTASPRATPTAQVEQTAPVQDGVLLPLLRRLPSASSDEQSSTNSSRSQLPTGGETAPPVCPDPNALPERDKAMVIPSSVDKKRGRFSGLFGSLRIGKNKTGKNKTG